MRVKPEVATPTWLLSIHHMSHVDRYQLGEPIARGGMGTLHLGRLAGSAGFARTVAIKRLHAHLVADPAIAESFVAEARLAARIRHPNVVPTLDVVTSEDSGVLLVMEYVDGESLSALMKASSEPIPLPIVVAIVSEMLHGLHSAHEARSEAGEPLAIIHRDVSPQNVLVGADGIARLVDFGIARASNQVESTSENELKGKLAYMAPEQIRRERTTQQVDIYAAGIVLWELLTGQRLFASEHPGATIEKILVGWVAPPSSVVRGLPPALDEIALRALDPEPSNRFASAREMAMALEDAVRRALGREVGAWVEARAGHALARRRALLAATEHPGVATAPFVAAGAEETATLLIEDETSGQAVVMPPAPPPPKRSRALPVALLTFAAAVTVLVSAARPHPVAAMSFDPLPPPVASIVAPAVIATETPSAVVAPKVVVEAPRPAAPRRIVPAAPRMRHAPCIAKLDPVTQKKVYQGDCD